MKLTGVKELKEKHLGAVGTPRRDKYEQELKLELLAEEIKALRIENNLTQEQLGMLIGVRRAQISKIENGKSNVTLGTILKVFGALKARINFNVEKLESVNMPG